MKLVTVTIKGRTPYLMCRFTEDSEQGKGTRKMLVKRGTPKEEATKLLYKDDQGRFFFPSSCIGRMIRAVASNHKLKGSRKSAKYVVPSAIFLPDEIVILTNGDGKTPLDDWETDSRPVVIPSTKGRIMRHRPRFDQWSATFKIQIDDELLEPDFVQQLIVEAGSQNGLGDFRPEKGGPFGTFSVICWNET